MPAATIKSYKGMRQRLGEEPAVAGQIRWLHLPNKPRPVKRSCLEPGSIHAFKWLLFSGQDSCNQRIQAATCCIRPFGRDAMIASLEVSEEVS